MKVGCTGCIGCGKCEQHCPQGIPIMEELKNVKSAFEGPVYHTLGKIIKKILKY